MSRPTTENKIRRWIEAEWSYVTELDTIGHSSDTAQPHRVTPGGRGAGPLLRIPDERTFPPTGIRIMQM